MAKQRSFNLTDSMIGRARPKPDGEPVELWDSTIRGLHFRKGPRLCVGYLRFVYRGERRRLRLGRWPEHSLADIRDLASEARRLLDRGLDPGRTLDRNRRGELTLSELFAVYLEKHGPHKRESSLAGDRGNFRKHIEPALGQLRLSEVRPEDVQRLVLAMKDGGASPSTRNRVLALVRSLFARAEEWELLPPAHVNPASRVAKAQEATRERVLDSEELKRLGEALGELTAKAKPTEAPSFRLFKLLALTGLRISEAATLKWEDVSLDHGTALLRQTKTSQRVAVLGRPAVELLRAMPRDPSGYLFPSHRRPGEALDRHEARGPWLRLTKAAGLDGLRVHDLRHLVATKAAGSGASLHQVGGLLGHRSTAVTGRYAHHVEDGLRELASETGEAIEAALAGKIVELHPSKAAKGGKRKAAGS